MTFPTASSPDESGPLPEPGLTIAAVERETGLGKDTLRVWERRYGFPQPRRDAAGDRVYSAEQVQQLKLICRLLDSGLRPNKVVGLDREQLQALTAATVVDLTILSTTEDGRGPDLNQFLSAIESHSPQTLRQRLNHAQARMGLGAFVMELVAPLNIAVGEAWVSGRFEVFEEHLYTEVVTNVLHHAIASLVPSTALESPKVLLTTLPQELHSLGLLMVEAVLTLEGAECVSLGTQTPVGDVVQAAQAHAADIVGISCSNAHGGPGVLMALRELRTQLPVTTALWAGGSCAALYQRPVAGISVVGHLAGLPPLLAHWRQTRIGA